MHAHFLLKKLQCCISFFVLIYFFFHSTFSIQCQIKTFFDFFFVQTTYIWIVMWQLYVWNGSINLQRPGNKSRLLRYVGVWTFECKIMVFIISNIIILTHSLATRNLPHKWMKTKLKKKKLKLMTQVSKWNRFTAEITEYYFVQYEFYRNLTNSEEFIDSVLGWIWFWGRKKHSHAVIAENK